MRTHRPTLYILRSVVITLSLVAAIVSARSPARVLILPFNIHSDQDMSFLKKGIENMLSTRLTLAGEVKPIDEVATKDVLRNAPDPIDEAAALKLGAEANADYVVLGSLTVLGNSISTDVKFFDVETNQPIVAFSQFGKEPGEVLFHINLFAAEVNEKAFGRKTYTYRKETTTDEQVKRRQHPDALMPSDNFIVTESGGTDLWRSRRFRSEILGLAVGDVDGDNRNEVAFIDKDALMIYRHMEGRFEKVWRMEGRTGSVFLAVDVADINQNGFSEIFVTSVSLNESKMNSFVVEWTGKTFKKIIKAQNWYYRVIQAPNRGNILIGQKRGTQSLFWKSVYELEWGQKGYIPADKLPLPKGQRIFGFTFGDVMNIGRDMVISYNKSDYLLISDMAGKKKWVSGNRFGGTPVFVENTSVFDSNPNLSKSRYYLPQRIHLVDIDNDGKKDVITVKNEEAISRAISSRLRIYKSGHIECLSWDTMGFRQKWKTRENAGFIGDSAIADIDNDGKDELVFALNGKTSPIVGSNKCYVVAMKFNK